MFYFNRLVGFLGIIVIFSSCGALSKSTSSPTLAPPGSGADGSGASGSTGGNGSPGGSIATLSSLRTSIFNVRCNGCHSGGNPSGGFDITSYGAILSRVVPLNANASLLHIKVVQNVHQNINLSTQQKSDIDTWINSGAANN